VWLILAWARFVHDRTTLQKRLQVGSRNIQRPANAEWRRCQKRLAGLNELEPPQRQARHEAGH